MLRIAPALFAAALAYGQPFGDHLVLTPGTSSFTVPEKTLSVSLLCIGAGGAGAFNAREPTGCGGGGGGLAYVNDVAVSPGDVLQITVGAGGNTSGGYSTCQCCGTHNPCTAPGAGGAGAPGAPSFISLGAATFVYAGGGSGGVASNGTGDHSGGAPACGGAGGCAQPALAPKSVGFCGGDGGYITSSYGYGASGGGAAGYSGNGGLGGSSGSTGSDGGDGGGGGGGGGGGCFDASGSYDCSGARGGGVGLGGQGADGKGGKSAQTKSYSPFSGAAGGSGSGGGFGSGGAGYIYSPELLTNAYGGNGACRVMFGAGRSFPHAAAFAPPPPPLPGPSPPPAPPTLHDGLPWQCGTSLALGCYTADKFEFGILSDLSPAANDLQLEGTVEAQPVAPGRLSGLVMGGDACGWRDEFHPPLAAAFTAAAWVHLRAAGTGLFSVNRPTEGDLDGVLAAFTDRAFDHDGAQYGMELSAAQAPALNRWTHVVLVRSGGAAAFYLDGKANGAVTFDSSVAYPPKWLVLGCAALHGAAPFNGGLGEFALFNQDLSAAAVAQLFNAQAPRYGV